MIVGGGGERDGAAEEREAFADQLTGRLDVLGSRGGRGPVVCGRAGKSSDVG